MGRWLFCIWNVLLFLLAGQARAQTVSSEGTDFWTVFPTHNPSQNRTDVLYAELSVFVTAKANTVVTVSCGNYSNTSAISANAVIEFRIPREQSYINSSEANIPLTGRGIHIKVNEGMPAVSAYAHMYAGARSAASLILPYEALGQQYYSMNYLQKDTGDNFLVLIAVQDDTKVRIHPKGTSNFISVNLPKAGDVYQYMSPGADLTGTFVEIDPSTPCQRFAAYSGSNMIEIGNCPSPPDPSYDPLYQQLYPVDSWGRNYGVVPFINRTYILRILAQEDQTVVHFNGETRTINRGEFIETDKLSDAISITSDKLISVAQYALTQTCSGLSGRSATGDPDMVILNPIEFSIKNITVFSSTKQNIDAGLRYINVLIRKNAAQSFRINNVQPGVRWQQLNDNPLYVYAQIPITEESLTLKAAEGFNAIAYGFGDHESYAYSAGTNLASNNYLTVVNKNNGDSENPNGCIGDRLDFKITLPYLPSSLTWTLDSTITVTTSQIPQDTLINGERLYIYTLPAGMSYQQVGEHRLDVIASVPQTANNCINGNIISGYIFNIYEHPVAEFETAMNGCVNNAFQFTDVSKPNATDFSITEWRWDFGDTDSASNFSEEQNPTHIFSQPGEYTVKLWVKAGTGCFSNVYEKKVTIYPLPDVKFNVQDITCIGTSLTFTDQSLDLVDASIVKRSWDFGDGSDLVEKTDSAPINHSFSKAGTYTVTLRTTSIHGCQSEPLSFDIIVTALPVADFQMPDFCLSDGIAKFTNTSVNADGSPQGLSYEWIIREKDKVAVLGNYRTKDAEHRFSDTGYYEVKLIVRNANGCEVVKDSVFTVNGSVSSAFFSIKNSLPVCANQQIIFNNEARATFGRITKIEIYQDFFNHPAAFITVPYPGEADQLLSYPNFGGNIPKSYKIRVVAYSGASCSAFHEEDIVINPSPQLSFASLSAVCENDGLVDVSTATETSGMVMQSGVYSGAYVNSKGIFDAKAAGAGKHEITYTFTGINGCPASIVQEISVLKSPEADAGPTIYILSGASTIIQAKASGPAALRYQWSPSTGLNRDDILNPIASPAKDTKYKLTAFTSEGCEHSSEVWIRVLQEIKPPNAFSPNGDGVNDTWEIAYLIDYPNPSVQVFNRSGENVFFSQGYSISFDGNYKGEALPVGTYYYIINPNYNGRKRITGSLTIIR